MRPLEFVGAFILCICMCLGLPVAAAPADAPRPIDVPAGELAAALEAVAKQTDLELVFQPEQLKGLRTSGVKGLLTPRDAVEKLLEGMPLQLKRDKTTGAMMIGAKAPTDVSTHVPRAAKVRLSQVDDASRSPQAPEADAPFLRESSQQVQELVVTGTNIRVQQNRTVSINVIDREQIERSGYSTTQELFESLPQNFGGGPEGASEDGAFGLGQNRASNFTAGTGANLRGLGTSATLVLLNGHRLAPTQFGRSVDLSLVPLAAIERIEVLADGSSAIYGSDAIAGVINIILRSDYEGAETRARLGGASAGGRDERLLAQSLGAGWSGGNAILMLQYQEAGRLGVEERPLGDLMQRPNDVLPETRSRGAGLTVQHHFSDSRWTGFGLRFSGLMSARYVRSLRWIPIPVCWSI